MVSRRKDGCGAIREKDGVDGKQGQPLDEALC